MYEYHQLTIASSLLLAYEFQGIELRLSSSAARGLYH